MKGARLISGTGEWTRALKDEDIEPGGEYVEGDERVYTLSELVGLCDAGDEWAGRVLAAVGDWIFRTAGLPSFPGGSP